MTSADKLYEIRNDKPYLNCTDNKLKENCIRLLNDIANGEEHNIYDWQVLVLMLRLYAEINDSIAEDCFLNKHSEEEHFIKYIVVNKGCSGICGDLILAAEQKKAVLWGGIKDGISVQGEGCFSLLCRVLKRVEENGVTLGDVSFILFFSYIRNGENYDDMYRSLTGGTLHRLIYLYKSMIPSMRKILEFYEGTGAAIKRVISEIDKWIEERSEEVRDMGFILW